MKEKNLKLFYQLNIKLYKNFKRIKTFVTWDKREKIFIETYTENTGENVETFRNKKHTRPVTVKHSSKTTRAEAREEKTKGKRGEALRQKETLKKNQNIYIEVSRAPEIPVGIPALSSDPAEEKLPHTTERAESRTICP